MKKYSIIPSLLLCGVYATAEVPSPPPVDPAFEEAKRAIEAECQASPPCDEEKILCFIRRAHELRESGGLCPQSAQRLIREGEMRLAFRRGFQEGMLAAGQGQCRPPHGQPKPPGDGGSDDSGEKVAICHVPPGNPANAHTIRISASAVAAHLAHGDYEGECKSSDGSSGKGKKDKSDKSSKGKSSGKSKSKKSSKK